MHHALQHPSHAQCGGINMNIPSADVGFDSDGIHNHFGLGGMGGMNEFPMYNSPTHYKQPPQMAMSMPMHDDPEPMHPSDPFQHPPIANHHRFAPAATTTATQTGCAQIGSASNLQPMDDDKHSSLCSHSQPRSVPAPPHQNPPPHRPPSAQSHPLRWSTMSFSYSTNGQHSSGAIQMPSNFSYTPADAAHSDRPTQMPFQVQVTPRRAPSPVPFSWSPINEQLMHKLFRLEPYFRNKVVLELGAGFGIASMVSLHLGAKHVLLTDAHPEILSLLPVILQHNRVAAHRTTVLPLQWQCKEHHTQLLAHCQRHLAQSNVDLLLAADVIQNTHSAQAFFESVDFFFAHFIATQRAIFRRHQTRDRERAQATPSVQRLFADFAGDARMDVNRPLTNGGCLPLRSRRARKRAKINKSIGPPTTNESSTQSLYTASSHSDDDHSGLSSNVSSNASTFCSSRSRASGPPSKNLRLPMDGRGSDEKSPPRDEMGHFGLSSLSALETIVDVPLLDASRLEGSGLRQRIRKRREVDTLGLPKLLGRNASGGDTMEVDGVDEVEMASAMSAEEEEFVSAMKAKAPVLIIAQQKVDEAHAEGWALFRAKCLDKGYRVNNVSFEWRGEIWMVKL